jgi:hypothetical protein
MRAGTIRKGFRRLLRCLVHGLSLFRRRRTSAPTLPARRLDPAAAPLPGPHLPAGGVPAGPAPGAVTGLDKGRAEDWLDWLEAHGAGPADLDCSPDGFSVRPK